MPWPGCTAERFKRISRQVTNEVKWIRRISYATADEQQLTNMRTMQEHADTSHAFNVAAFHRSVRMGSALSLRDKQALRKEHCFRTPAEKDRVVHIISSVEALKKFSPLVRRELAKKLTFEQFDDGRIIIRQGHVGVSIYFIIKGSVTLEAASVDPVTGVHYKQMVSEVIAGGSFGEMSPLKTSVREHTVICRGKSDFLRIDRNELEKVLNESLKSDSDRKVSALVNCPIFHGWLLKELKAISEDTDILYLDQNHVLIADLALLSDYMYILLSGSCQAVRKLRVVIESIPYRPVRMRLLATTDRCSPRAQRFLEQEDIFAVVRNLESGDCFGFGEHLPDTCIMTSSRAEVMRIPIGHLSRPEKQELMSCACAHEISKYPSNEQSFKSLRSARRWQTFKREMHSEILNRKKDSGEHCFRDTTDTLPPLPAIPTRSRTNQISHTQNGESNHVTCFQVGDGSKTKAFV